MNPRTLEHAKLLVENMELIDIWKEYGLVGDVIVSYSSPCLGDINSS